ncbi:GGDEF domain-containing protein [Pseudoalteromonas sp. BDTF-M6]|uniref:GGDEF domain-containing protein n=1 Tax=Pseudoalteromonas sp. BDTF-M6 TaxID=2796132 RepID=UPI001BAFE9CB|nr:GGDEF domain-containing protein [Pseudoalteromonas sp. BDTF-M6]MBS3798677.1 GGDEF domain-containing protein [Pseudoalteromonas sp. BDTF-M6]
MDNVHILTYGHTAMTQDASTAAHFYRPTSVVNVTALTQELQRSLELPTLLDIFAEHVRPHAYFTGLQLHSCLGVNEMTNSQDNAVANRFDIEVEGEHLGRLVYLSDATFSAALQEQLKKWQQVLAYPLRNALTYNRVLRLATRDPLTGLNNRSDFNMSVEKKLEACRRQHRPFSLMLLDLDYFKQVNDNYGHQVGDQTLQEFATLLRQSVRATDSIFRFGGDEFAILIDDDHYTTNTVIAERIQAAVGNSELMNRYGVSCSIGFALAQAKDVNISLFERADKALYQAKFSGRNTYQGASELSAVPFTSLNAHNDNQKPPKNAKIS